MVRYAQFHAVGLLMLLVLACSNTCGAGGVKVIVGGDQNFPPYEFLENGEPAGFNIDLVKAVAEATELDIEIRLSSWSKARLDLQNGKIDMLAGMVYSEERSKLFEFSVPHTMISPALFVRKDSPIRSIKDIAGKKIIVEKDDIMHDFLRKEQLAANIITASTAPETLRLLASGKYDGALVASEIHKYFIAEKFGFENILEIKTDLPPRNYCFAVTGGNDILLHKLDKGLIFLKSTGRYQQIYNKWFGVYEEKKWWDTVKYFVFFLTLIAGFFVVSLLWSWSLNKRVNYQTTKLRKNEQELWEAHAGLEKRVAERTADLALANEKLSSEIGERNRAETALRDSEAKYRAIVDAFVGQIYICSPEYRIEFMNEKLIERTGWDGTGELCYKVLHDREDICPWCVNVQILQGETVSLEMQSPKDNRWYYIVNTPIHHPNDSISKQAMILDITERVETEKEKQELEEKNKRLLKIKSLDRMAGAIAHHFNNKLHVVIGHLEMALNNRPYSDNIMEPLQKSFEAANKAAEVSRSMLTYLGKVNDKQDTIDLAEVCSKGLSQIEGNIPEHVNLKTRLLPRGPIIRGNANQIQLILNNVIRNSWEAIGDAPGTVSLGVERVPSSKITSEHRFPVNWQPKDEEYACLEIRDTGCGMTAGDIETAFDPFFSTKFTGRGLGLSVVHGLVQAHGAAATVESSPGQGSSFRFYFPLSTEEAPSREKIPANRAQALGTGTVLLVDDDQIVLTMTSAMLSHLGYSVLTAMNGREAMQIYQRCRDEISFVISDFAMPEMNGLEMLTSLRQINPEIAVIVASGYSEEQVMASGAPEQPQAFIEKPFAIEELKKAINLVLPERPA